MTAASVETHAESAAMFRDPSFFNRTPLLPVLAFSLATPFAFGATPQTNGANSAEAMFETFSRPIPGVDWEEMSPHFVQMLDRVFERNGWTDESDQYAKKVALRIAELPPWDLPGRFGALSDEVTARYGLTPQQTTMFQRAVMRESAAMLIKHGPAMWEQAQEALQGRAEGKPYNAEQIARWAKMGRPLFDEMESSIERVAAELEESLPEDKKSVLQKDMAGFHKRQKVVEAMNERWARGLWEPDEWGLEDDPIQTAAARTESPQPDPEPLATTQAARPTAPLVAPAVTAAPIPDHWIEHDPTTWIAFVLEIRKNFRLDAGQMDTAWSIHAELVERAGRYAKLRTAQLAEIPSAQRPTHEAYKPIRDLFAELRDRLEALPTSTQREASRK